MCASEALKRMPRIQQWRQQFIDNQIYNQYNNTLYILRISGYVSIPSKKGTKYTRWKDIQKNTRRRCQISQICPNKKLLLCRSFGRQRFLPSAQKISFKIRCRCLKICTGICYPFLYYILPGSNILMEVFFSFFLLLWIWARWSKGLTANCGCFRML